MMHKNGHITDYPARAMVASGKQRMSQAPHRQAAGPLAAIAPLNAYAFVDYSGLQ